MAPKVFFEFTLPNATTWSFFSLLLAVALFFKFSRWLSMRNWDVVTLYVLVPGLLLIQEAHRQADVGASPWLWPGYLWLLCGTGYFLIRSFVDLTLVRRPALSPNLNQGGLAWLGGALGICLISVALRQTQGPAENDPAGKPQGPAEIVPVGKVPTPVAEVTGLVEAQVKNSAVAKFGNYWVQPCLALFCHFAVVVALVLIGCRHFQDAHAGMAAGTFYLLLPYTAIHIGQLHLVWPVALLVWAVAAYRKPMASGLLIGLAAGSAYFPALVFPVWFGFYRGGRGMGRFVVAFLLAALLGLAARVWWQGGLEQSLQDALEIHEWQPWKQSVTEGFWRRPDGASVHWAYRLPVFIAYLAFLVVFAFWPNPKNLAHVLALTTFLLLGVQFWYADQGGIYVLWYLPLLLLLVFRPNLSDRRPPIIQPEDDPLSRLGRALGRSMARLLRIPESPVRVP